MGFHSFVLLTATVLLACVNCSSKATTATFPVQETTERPNRRFATRFLRSSEPTDGDDEARMLSLFNEAKSVYRTLQARYMVWNWMVAYLKVLKGFIQFSGHVEDSRAALVDALVISFGGKRKFLEALLNPTTRLQNSDAVMDLEKVLLAGWETRNLHPQDVIKKELGLTTADDLFSPAMTTFLKYVTNFSIKNKQESYSLAELEPVYGVAPVSRALINADMSGKNEYLKQFLYDLHIRHSNGALKETSPADITLINQAFEEDDEFCLVIAKAMTEWKNSRQPQTKDDLLVLEDMAWLDDALDERFEKWYSRDEPENVENNFSVDDADKPYMAWIAQKYAEWVESVDQKIPIAYPRRV